MLTIVTRGGGAALVARVQGALAAERQVIVAVDGEGVPLVQRWAGARTALASLMTDPRLLVTVLSRTASSPHGGQRLRALPAWLGSSEITVDADSAATEAPPSRARALVVLRGQPFHRGHKALIEKAIERCGEAIVVVAAADRSHTATDPFTAGERIAFVRAATAPVSHRIWLVAVPQPAWAALSLTELDGLVPPYDTVVTHNRTVEALAREAGKEIVRLDKPVTVDGVVVSATKLRGDLTRNGPTPWAQARVPDEVWPLVTQPALLSRLKLVSAPEHG